MAARNASITVESQNFLTEAINKERDTRLIWHQKRKGQAIVKPRQMEVFRRNIEERSKPSEALMERLPAITKEQRFNKKKTSDLDTLVSKSISGDVNAVLNMRPATPKTHRQLYEGFTKEGKGRYQYLQSRYFQIPEEKFPYPILNSWEYGWRLNDVVKKEEIKKPVFGRTRIVADTFYTRTGAI